MEKHADKGRVLVSQAVLRNPNIKSFELINNALNCILAYDDSRTIKLKKILKRCKNGKRT